MAIFSQDTEHHYLNIFARGIENDPFAAGTYVLDSRQLRHFLRLAGVNTVIGIAVATLKILEALAIFSPIGNSADFDIGYLIIIALGMCMIAAFRMTLKRDDANLAGISINAAASKIIYAQITSLGVSLWVIFAGISAGAPWPLAVLFVAVPSALIIFGVKRFIWCLSL